MESSIGRGRVARSGEGFESAVAYAVAEKTTNQALVVVKGTAIAKAKSIANLKPYKLGAQLGTTVTTSSRTTSSRRSNRECSTPGRRGHPRAGPAGEDPERAVSTSDQTVPPAHHRGRAPVVFVACRSREPEESISRSSRSTTSS